MMTQIIQVMERVSSVHTTRHRSYSYERYTIWQMIGLNQFGYYQSVLVLMKYILRFDSEPRLTNPHPTGQVILLRVD